MGRYLSWYYFEFPEVCRPHQVQVGNLFDIGYSLVSRQVSIIPITN